LHGATPLHCAVRENNVELVNCILEQPGVEVNRATWDGTTALCMAISCKLSAIESILRRASGMSAAANDDTSDETDSDIEEVNE